MASKKKKEPLPRIYLVTEVNSDIVEDTYGCDGPYTGFRQERQEVEFKSLHKSQPENNFFYDSYEVSDPALLSAEEIYLAVVRYSDGGTFGNTSGYYQVVGLFKTTEEAEELLKNLDQLDYKPWESYFSRLEDTEVHCLKLEA